MVPRLRRRRGESPLDNHILIVKIYSLALQPPAPMPHDNTDIIQGTLDMLILRTVSLGPIHGYGIGRHIERVSNEVFKVNPGSLLTALKRLERAGWLDAEWRQTENARRARYYSLTAAGRRRLATDAEDWRRRSAAVARLLAVES